MISIFPSKIVQPFLQQKVLLKDKCISIARHGSSLLNFKKKLNLRSRDRLLFHQLRGLGSTLQLMGLNLVSRASAITPEPRYSKPAELVWSFSTCVILN